MNRHRLIMLTTATVAMSFFAHAQAGELHVPEDFSTIQAAIDASVDGDEVVIADGAYTGDGNKNLDFGGRAITVRSENGPEACIIDCEGVGRAFWFRSGESFGSVLQEISIINGVPPRGEGARGGAVRIDGTSPIIKRCQLSHNRAVIRGGAVAVLSGSPLFQDCLFDDNVAEETNSNGGGAIYSEGSPRFVDCTFTDNYGGSFGGAIFSSAGMLELTRCTFIGNESLSEGGGAVMVHDARVEDCTFIDSRTQGRGGAIRHETGNLVARGCRFLRSSAATGAAIYSLGDRSYILNCTFEDGSTGGDGGGCEFWQDGVHNVHNCKFLRGRANDGGGGVAGNREATVIVTNSTFNGGFARPPDFYGAVLAGMGSRVTVFNCVLWGNTAEEAGGDGDLAISYSVVRGGWPGEGNIDADPLFVDAENGDLRLLAGSPAIDSGDNLGVAADVFDLDGDGNTEEPVPFDLDGYGRFVDDLDTEDTGRCDDPCEMPIVDMGAYEFGMATGACCDAQIGDCTDDLPDEDCIDGGGRFAADTLCADLDPPCVAPPCVRDPQWVCDGDVDGDGQVNPVDAGLVQAAFGSADHQDLCNYDVDCDGQINPVDSGIVQSLFGTCQAPRDACP